MIDKSDFDKCLTFIGTQLESKPSRLRRKETPQPAVTISRQTGAGGLPVANQLAEYLQTHGPEPQRPWTVFDRNLVAQVLQDHQLPREIARYMPEDKISQLNDMVEELLGLHPPSWTLIRQSAETILHLAELGNVILVGYGSHVITAPLNNVFHVRLTGSEEKRVELVQEFYHLNRKAALDFMRKEDRGRRRFLRKYFGKDIDDPLLYHLTINTDWIPFAEAARIIGDAVLRRFPSES